VVAATVVLLIPALQEQGTDFAAQLPNLYDGVVRWLNDTSETVGIDLGEVWTSDTIQDWIQNPDNQATIQELLGGFGSGAGRSCAG
jgi:predicted PurR-regulated permease PerM